MIESFNAFVLEIGRLHAIWLLLGGVGLVGVVVALAFGIAICLDES